MELIAEVESMPLRILEAVVRTSSFRDAADELAMASSTVQKAMRSLEKEWDLNLFTRSGRNIRPTETAIRIAEVSEPWLRQQVQLCVDIERIRQESDSRVRLACAPVHMARALGAVIRKSQRRWPDLQIDVEWVDQSRAHDVKYFDQLLDRGADFVATIRSLPDRSHTMLWSTQLVVVGGDLPTKVRVRDLLGFTVFAQPEVVWSRQQLELMAEREGVQLDVVTEALPEVAVGMAKAGLGVAVMADDSLPHLPGARPLVGYRNELVADDVKLHWRKGSLSNAQERFLNVVQTASRTKPVRRKTLKQ